MIIAIENPFDPDPLSKLSIAEMEREFEEIMERSGFIIPPRAAALQDELGKRRARRLHFNSTFGKLASGDMKHGLKRGELNVLSAKTSRFASRVNEADDRLVEHMLAYDAVLQAELDAHITSTKIPDLPKDWIQAYVKDQLDRMPKAMYYQRTKLSPFEDDVSDFFKVNPASEEPLTATAQMARNKMQFGLLPAPSGIQPMTLEVGRELIRDRMTGYISYNEEAWKELRDLTIKPAIITAKAPSVDVFDDDVSRMYPHTMDYIGLLHTVDHVLDIKPQKSYTIRNTMEFKVRKDRDIIKAPTKLTFDATTNRLDFMSDELS